MAIRRRASTSIFKVLGKGNGLRGIPNHTVGLIYASRDNCVRVLLYGHQKSHKIEESTRKEDNKTLYERGT